MRHTIWIVVMLGLAVSGEAFAQDECASPGVAFVRLQKLQADEAGKSNKQGFSWGIPSEAVVVGGLGQR